VPRPEQTEKPTPKRQKEARNRGQVPRSTELAGAIIFFISVFVIYAYVSRSLSGISGIVGVEFARAGQHDEPTIHSVWFSFVQAFGPVAMFLGVLFAISIVVGIGANIAQFGLLFTLYNLRPNLGKLNPLTGVQRLFSIQILVNLGKQIVKLTAVILIAYSVISKNIGFLTVVGQTTPTQFLLAIAALAFEFAWKYGLLLVVVGLIDYAYQRWQLERNLKMSKQEIKDEQRQQEGNPEAKGALKRKQREFARRRMMAAVPRATVVVTNPTHYAVALEWDEVKMEAPVVVAKGVDLVALRIREIATEHGVPIMENPPLARTLFERVDLDQAIPPNLYAAVAQVIAFVFKLKRKTIA
jgi:flagellar biosynthetic protein FlhB